MPSIPSRKPLVSVVSDEDWAKIDAKTHIFARKTSYVDYQVDDQGNSILKPFLEPNGREIITSYQLRRAKPSTLPKRPRCGARRVAGGTCRAWVVLKPDRTFSDRCARHGGKSSGPKSSEGRAAIAESNRRRAKRVGAPAPTLNERFTAALSGFVAIIELHSEKRPNSFGAGESIQSVFQTATVAAKSAQSLARVNENLAEILGEIEQLDRPETEAWRDRIDQVLRLKSTVPPTIELSEGDTRMNRAKQTLALQNARLAETIFLFHATCRNLDTVLISLSKPRK